MIFHLLIYVLKPMQSKTVALILLFSCCFGLGDISAQETEPLSSSSRRARRAYERAEMAFRLYDIENAISALESALARDDQFIEARLLLADIYYNEGKYLKSIPQWQAAITIDSLFFPPAYFYLGEALLRIGRYKEACESFQTVIQSGMTSNDLINRSMERMVTCDFALHAIKNPVDFVPVNPGPAINSHHAEYSPALTADEQTLIFTRKKPLHAHHDQRYEHYYEDFYVSHFQNGQWSSAENLGPPINTRGNEGAQSITADGRHLYFTACNRLDGFGSCDIYYARRVGGSWSRPVNVGKPLNSAAWDSQPSISADGQSIYFASSRNGSHGQIDIWMATRNESGNWNEPTNLGPVINTKGRELSPFIHPDNQTLYFASDGHPGMGGLDIFYSRRENDGSWSRPVNIGYPINSYGDEFALFVGASGQWAWFASDKEGGYGKSDIYYFELYPEARPTPVTFMKGLVYDIETGTPIGADFVLTDVKTGEVIIESQADPNDGAFLVAIPTGRNLALNVSSTGYLFFSESFSYADHKSSIEPYLRNIPLQPVSEGFSVVMRNIFFETDSYALQASSYPELEHLYELLVQNPKLMIEIRGHTDSTGSFEYNMALSEKRAGSVRDHLIEQGIAADRIIHAGYADTIPIDTNETAEGRANNRRTEFKIIRVQ